MTKPTEATWVRRYYQALVGGTVTKITTKRGEYGQVWPVIHVRMPDRHVYKCEVSQDEEGNGPGFLFGLPVPQ